MLNNIDLEITVININSTKYSVSIEKPREKFLVLSITPTHIWDYKTEEDMFPSWCDVETYATPESRISEQLVVYFDESIIEVLRSNYDTVIYNGTTSTKIKRR